MGKRSFIQCRYIKALQSILYLAVIYGLVGGMLFAQSAANAQSQEQTIQSVRLGNWPGKTRLVLEGLEGMTAQVLSGSSAQAIRIQFSFPKAHDAQERLLRLIPPLHHAIADISIQTLTPTSMTLELRFHRPTVVEIFSLRAMEGFSSRLVIDFHESEYALDELWVDVVINGKTGFGTVLALAFKNEDVLLTGEDLSQWRVVLPNSNYLDYFGSRYYSLRDIGVKSYLNSALLQLHLEIPAQQFADLKLQGHQREQIELTQASPGFYLNYDISATHNDDISTASGYAELGMFNAWGSFKYSSLHNYDNLTQAVQSMRLDSVWRTDFPDQMASLYLGDFTTRTAGWDRNLRAAGIKWETNFTTQPELIKAPFLAFTGLANEPSTVDLYINDALRFRRSIPAGPFSIDDLPSLTGYGDVQMVITDTLGRTQVVRQSYFADRRVLRTGLHDYSYALGAVRYDYGLRQADYRGWLVNAYHRYGMSPTWTAEYSARLSDHYQMISFGGVHVLPWRNSLNFSIATSHQRSETGHLLQLGIQHQRRSFSFGIDLQKSFDGFQISQLEQVKELPELQLSSFVTWSSSSFGNMRLAYTEQTDIGQNVAFVNAGYSTNLGSVGYLSLNVLQFVTDEKELQVSINFNIPLGSRTNFTAGGTHYNQRDVAFVQVQRQAPAGYGFGYRLRHGFLEQSRSQADVNSKTSYGNYELNYENAQALNTPGSKNRETYRASIAGSLVALTTAEGNYFSMGQPIQDSFGLVQLPKLRDIKIYADNQHVATTNADGLALIPRLRAYQRNRIRLDAEDLPFHANFSSLQREVAPYHRSGIVIDFPISKAMSVMINVVDTHGNFIPVGAQAQLAELQLTELGTSIMIGYDGLLYIAALEQSTLVTISYQVSQQQHQCTFYIQRPEGQDARHDLGVHVCN